MGREVLDVHEGYIFTQCILSILYTGRVWKFMKGLGFR